MKAFDYGCATPADAAQEAFFGVESGCGPDEAYTKPNGAWDYVALCAIEHPKAHEVCLIGCKPQRNETPGQAAKRAFDEIQPKRESEEFHMTASALWACVAAEAIAAHEADKLVEAGW